MAQTKGERIKLYVVIALAVLMLIVAYFRFFHKKGGAVEAPPESATVVNQIVVPQVAMKISRKNLSGASSNTAATRPFRAVSRDIFTPLERPARTGDQTVEQTRTLSLKLEGIIVGAGKPLAIINDQFVGLGDRIGEFVVIGIEKQAVRLSSNSDEIILEIASEE